MSVTHPTAPSEPVKPGKAYPEFPLDGLPRRFPV
jgi:hypothetical protein